MKKLIISLISGAVLIGIGIGVMMLEITEYSMIDTFPFVSNTSSQEFSFSDDEAFEHENLPIQIYGYLGEYFEDFGKVEIIEDNSVEGIDITIKYRGTRPRFYYNGVYYSGEDYYTYHLSAHSQGIMPKQILEAAEYICQNKTLVRYLDLFYVEKVIVRTSNPQMINFNI